MSAKISLIRRLINKLSNESWKIESILYDVCLRVFKKMPLPQPASPQAEKGKRIYLTFDDGPSPFTRELLNVLARFNVKATFFVRNGGDMDLLTQASAEGHAIGNHTFSHWYRKIYASSEAFFSDLAKMEAVIVEKTGTATRLMRFPGGSSNTVSIRFCPDIMTQLTAQAEALGYTYFDWDIDSGDADIHQTSRQTYRKIIKGIQNCPDPVVLQHDDKIHSVAAVYRILVWGLKNGYTFFPLDADSPTVHHILSK